MTYKENLFFVDFFLGSPLDKKYFTDVFLKDPLRNQVFNFFQI